MNYKYLFLAVVFSCVKTSYSQGLSALETEFQKSQNLGDYFYGFSLYDLDKEEFLYNHNESNHFSPASNTKVFTLFASLTHLGDSILGLEYIVRNDSLIFWGTGDPTFLHPEFDEQRVYNFLRETDKKLFYVPQSTQEPFYREGWAIEDYNYYYQPDISVFPIYGNVVNFKEAQNRLSISPAYFEKAVKQGELNGKYEISRALTHNTFEIVGMGPRKGFETNKPFVYSDTLFVSLLSDTLGREVKIIESEKPADVQRIYSVATKEVLREMMLPSDNFLAEHLIMQCAFVQYGAFNTRFFRAKMDKDYYSKLSDKIQFRDGSGLSAYNKITPRSMVEVLRQLYRMIPDDDSLYYFFPTGGLEGTLKGVYSLDLGKPFIWAKTGTIHAVHCQSGFIETRSGRKFAFSFLNNNYLGSFVPVRNEMVRIMTYIRQNY